ncbi:hypothetical protein [Pseudonocardia acidicola]|uniref:SWIM-type domain-containing protein n=1 Tax=Pseudonocardia acidicola TaxID=2724939 RepID=A0ABX1S503_9PSEU|nr:hypothetical protein [Pseudonocardia acidicola]NMH95842.1 hypothetical protein [Pseudonocardia acidicola]
MGWPATRTSREHSDRPLPGFKLAYPMLSADGTAAGFSGVTLGRAHVYRAVDDAICVHGSRHACPSRWCDCGFYCFHLLSAARDLACEPEYRGAVLLEVAVSGRYRRYERGLRYARQRVCVVRIGRCECARPAQVLADSGAGSVGWRRLVPVCAACAGIRPVLGPEVFGRLAGGITVTTDDAAAGPVAPLPAPAVPEAAGAVAVLSAEVALLQARLDDVQTRLDELTRRDEG